MKKIVIILLITLLVTIGYSLNRSKSRIYSFKEINNLNTELDNIYYALNSSYINDNLSVGGYVRLNQDLDTTSTPESLGIIAIDSNNDVYVSTGTSVSQWDKLNNNYLINTYELTTSSATSITLSGLDGDSADRYLLYFYMVGGSTSTGSGLSLTFNNDTSANYGYQTISSAASVTTSAKATTDNGILLSNYSFDKVNWVTCNMYVQSGSVRTVLWETLARGDTSTNIDFHLSGAGVWNDTVTNITSIELATDSAYGLNIGTKVELWIKR